MREIAVLDQITIDKIAAGEVVERPSSVVKELVENAIDAGASAITVETKEGGKSLIRITDNGCGISQNQVRLAFLRHATSKIEKAEDVEQVVSLGFRGEALSSISAVAQVEMITKTPEELSGTRYVIEGGAEKILEDVGAPVGTTLLVRNLFYNVPARSKFLRTAATEGSYISSLLEQLALSHPEISMKYLQNGQVKLHTSGNGNQKDVIYQIYGRDITRQLLPVDYEEENLAISGYIGKPDISRGNRGMENYYINGRYSKNRILTRAIEDAYQGFLMQHRFPFASLQIMISGNQLDVNVHPTKMEVRLRTEQDIYHRVYRILYDVLHGEELIPEISFEEKQKEQQTPKARAHLAEPFEQHRQTSSVPAKETKQGKTEQESTQSCGNRTAQSHLQTTAHHDDSAIFETQAAYSSHVTDAMEDRADQISIKPLLSEESRSRHRIIGQLFETYWLVEYEQAFYIIDQHAAHEKVLYEKIMRDLSKKEILSQYLNPPILVTLTTQEQTVFQEQEALFAAFGFEVEHFGGSEYQIRAVPSNLFGADEKDLFLEILGSLTQESAQSSETLLHKMASAACKAAVKGNQRLSVQEADRLIYELLKLTDPYHCPHGRPTIISMSKTEIEKKFKRIV